MHVLYVRTYMSVQDSVTSSFPRLLISVIFVIRILLNYNSLMFFTQTRGLVVYLLYFASLVLLKKRHHIFVGKPMFLELSNRAVQLFNRWNV